MAPECYSRHSYAIRLTHTSRANVPSPCLTSLHPRRVHHRIAAGATLGGDRLPPRRDHHRIAAGAGRRRPPSHPPPPPPRPLPDRRRRLLSSRSRPPRPRPPPDRRQRRPPSRVPPPLPRRSPDRHRRRLPSRPPPPPSSQRCDDTCRARSGGGLRSTPHFLAVIEGEIPRAPSRQTDLSQFPVSHGVDRTI